MLKLETRSVFMEHFLNKETQKIYVNISTFMTGRQKPAKIQKWLKKDVYAYSKEEAVT